MNTAVIILQLLATYGPDVAAAAQRIATSGKDPTHEEWEANIFAPARKTAAQFRAEAEARFAAKNPPTQ